MYKLSCFKRIRAILKEKEKNNLLYKGRPPNGEESIDDFTGQNFWAKGYYVSTLGRDERTIKKYIREQEAEDKRLDHLELFKES
jgi:REP element-mobilizing transposase RayT